MDLLKAELERKRRTISESSSKGGGSGSGDRGSSKRKKYLTVSERRRLEEEEEEEREEEELRRREKKKRRRKKKKRRGDDDSSDEDGDDGKESEDLTTILTKKYDPAERRRKAEAAAAAAAGASKSQGENNNSNAHDNDATREDEGQKSEAGGKNDISLSDSLKKLSPTEVTDTLRRFGLPVRLFGEQTIKIDNDNHEDGPKYDDTARLQRLAIAMKGHEAAMLGESERDEFLLDSANRTRNVFLKQDADDDNGGEAAVKSPAKSDNPGEGTTTTTRNTTNTAEMTEEERNDKPKRIYRYFKSLIRQWEDDLAKRPDAIKRTAAGKNETKTLKQCKDYIRPLFQLCKRRELEEDLQLHLFNIVTYCESGEFVKAHDAYMDVAIGRAAWPIGVTMVGIHARSGRAKIESSNVAHVMNSELHRKYLTSVKRLMSYNQKKRPDVHPSKKVMNL